MLLNLIDSYSLKWKVVSDNRIEDYINFYRKLFLSPIKVDELTEKHFPDYSFYDGILIDTHKKKKILFENSNTKKIKFIDSKENITIEQPSFHPVNILSEQDGSNILYNAKLDDYILYHSPYAFVSSKIINPMCIELPSSKENVEVFIENNFFETTLNKKTFVTKKNTTYEVEERFITKKESIFAIDYIISEDSVVNIISDLAGIYTSSSSINYLFILNKNSKVNFSLLGLGSGKIYVNIYTIIKGIGSEAKLTGCFLGKKDDQTIIITYINHKAPKNTSRVHINNVLFDKAKNFFFGLIKVEKEGQDVDAYEMNRNLLLSKQARTLSIPKLEIENNNLRCSHASSTSSIDEEILFYLSCRGLKHTDIVKLVATGFLIEPLLNHKYDNIIEKNLIKLLPDMI